MTYVNVVWHPYGRKAQPNANWSCRTTAAISTKSYTVTGLTEVAITEGMARGLLGEINVDGREYDNKLFDLIRLDEFGRYLYVYKHDFHWLLITVNPGG